MSLPAGWPAWTAPRARLSGKPARVGSSVPEVPTYRMLAIRASVAARAPGRRGAGAPAAAGGPMARPLSLGECEAARMDINDDPHRHVLLSLLKKKTQMQQNALQP